MMNLSKLFSAVTTSAIALSGWAGFSQNALANTFVYVSNADSGQIYSYRLDESNGDLSSIARTIAGKAVMPLAVSPNKRFLYAHVRSTPTQVRTYEINSGNGALTPVGTAALPLSAPYISVDRAGRYLFSVSYGENKIAVNSIAELGFVLEKTQTLGTGKQPHAVLADPSNRYVFATNLGDDRIEQFVFDDTTGVLKPNDSPAVVFPEKSPRHFRFSPDGRYVYALSETQGSVTKLSLDSANGRLKVEESVPGIPASLGLIPGKPHDSRDASGGAAAAPDPRAVIWAADLHLSPNGRFLYMSERNSSTIVIFSVAANTGALTYLKSIPTEAQPRGFNIDPRGRFLICSGEKSEFLSVFSIDAVTGDLRQLNRYPIPKSSNWVEIVEVP